MVEPVCSIEREAIFACDQFGVVVAERRLGEGGMAVVHEGRRPSCGGEGESFAIKTLLPSLREQPVYRRMFQTEARIGQLLDHPNLGRVLHACDSLRQPFLVMPRLEGITVRDLFGPEMTFLRHQPRRRLALACRIVADALIGLHHAHTLTDDDGQSYDIVHRDISPCNLFITTRGLVKVVDFGVATIRGCEDVGEGMVTGKHSYLQPEVLLEQPPGPEADVFSAGIVLWELLAGRRLFRRDSNADTLRAVLHADIEAPSVYNPAVDGELDQLVLRALEREPSRRIRSALQLAAGLEEHASSRAELAALVSSRSRVARPAAPTASLETGDLHELAVTAAVPATRVCPVPATRIDPAPGLSVLGDSAARPLPARALGLFMALLLFAATLLRKLPRARPVQG